MAESREWPARVYCWINNDGSYVEFDTSKAIARGMASRGISGSAFVHPYRFKTLFETGPERGALYTIELVPVGRDKPAHIRYSYMFGRLYGLAADEALTGICDKVAAELGMNEETDGARFLVRNIDTEWVGRRDQ